MTNCTLCELPTPDPPVTAEDVDGEYCCRGCLSVARHLDDVGADGVDPSELDPSDTTTTDDSSEIPDHADTTYLSVDGLHCSTCERFVASMATDADGVFDADVSYATDTAKVTYDPDVLDESDVPSILEGFGYSARLPDAGGDDDGDADHRVLVGSVAGMLVMLAYGLVLYPAYMDLPSLVALGVLAVTVALGMAYCGATFLLLYGPLRTALLLPVLQAATILAIVHVDTLSAPPVTLAVAVLATVVVFYTGFPFVRGAYVSVAQRQPNMDFLIALAVLAAYGYSVVVLAAGGIEVYFDVAVMVVLVVTLGDRIESHVKDRATSGLASFADARITDARRRTPDGGTETVPVASLEPGDPVVVNGGERIPVDGTVQAGTAAVDESLLTGEALPDTKRPGDAVTAGTVVTDDRLVIEVGDERRSTLDQLVELLWEVQSSRTGVQQFADRLATLFVPLIASLAVVTVSYYLWTGTGLERAILTGVTVLVVSCPCALGLATPLAVVAGVRAALDDGVVVTDLSLFERIDDVDVVVIDKTGTLTTGALSVVDVTGTDTTSGDILARAAAVEQFSEHPIARAIVDRADPPTEDVTAVESDPRGIAGTVAGTRVRVGHPDWVSTDGWDLPASFRDTAETERKAARIPVAVGWDGAIHGLVVLADDPRPEWKSVVETLAESNRELVVVTGDEGAAARRFEDHPDIDRVLAGVPPEGKAETVRGLRERGTVAMIGDGSNDAAALAAADLGVAMESGAELATDAADAVVAVDDLAAVPRLFDLARKTRARIRQNLGWALTYNAVAIPLAVTAVLNPLFAALAMAASSLIVVGNSARSVE